MTYKKITFSVYVILKKYEDEYGNYHEEFVDVVDNADTALEIISKKADEKLSVEKREFSRTVQVPGIEKVDVPNWDTTPVKCGMTNVNGVPVKTSSTREWCDIQFVTTSTTDNK